MVTAKLRKGLLLSLSRGATSQSLTLIAAINAAMDGSVQGIGTGRQIIGTSGNGRSVSFAIPDGAAEVTPSELLETYVVFYESYNRSWAALGIAEPTTSASDAAILARMLLDDPFNGIEFGDTLRPDFSVASYYYGQ